MGGTLAYMLGLRGRRACEDWLRELANLPTPVSSGGETRTFLSPSLSVFLLFSLFLFIFCHCRDRTAINWERHVFVS